MLKAWTIPLSTVTLGEYVFAKFLWKKKKLKKSQSFVSIICFYLALFPEDSDNIQGSQHNFKVRGAPTPVSTCLPLPGWPTPDPHHPEQNWHPHGTLQAPFAQTPQLSGFLYPALLPKHKVASDSLLVAISSHPPELISLRSSKVIDWLLI